jgi:hypothetical protein
VNSKVVDGVIRTLVYPILRDHGFDAFTTRSAWRHRDCLTDVINFQSFNRSNADVLGCTTFSFAINLGLFVNDAADASLHPSSGGQPHEAACHIRRRIRPIRGLLPEARDIWVIDARGTNVESSLRDAAFQVLEIGIPWFDYLLDRAVVLAVLLGEMAAPDRLTWLPGNPGSKDRNRTIGDLASALGKAELAAPYLVSAREQERKHEEFLRSISRPVRPGRAKRRPQ